MVNNVSKTFGGRATPDHLGQRTGTVPKIINTRDADHYIHVMASNVIRN